MDELKRLIAAGPSFVVIYLLLMLPTYFLPYMGSNSMAANAGLAVIDAAAGGGNGLNLPLFVHLAALGGLMLIGWLRGSAVGKTWIVVFPVLAAVFDMVPGLNWIPLIPTAMHIACIIVGVSSQPLAE
jgi:hypothetical protein